LLLVRALEDGVQPPVAAQPGKRPFSHPADAGRNELSVSAARNGLDGDAECLTGLGQPLAAVAENPSSGYSTGCAGGTLASLAKRWTLETATGEFTQNRDDGFRVMAVRWDDIDRQTGAG
jgi:hypothetical protein